MGAPKPAPTPLFRLADVVPQDPAIAGWTKLQPAGLGRIALRWFAVMRACGPDVREGLHDGHPTACVGDAAFAYVDAFKEHVNVGFFRGAELPDPGSLLEGKGKAMRHVKVRPEDNLADPRLETLVRAADEDMKKRVRAEASRTGPR